MGSGDGVTQRQQVDGDPPRGGRRPILLISACLLVGLSAGSLLYLAAAKVYQASATVLVLPTSTGLEPGSLGSSDISMETEAELARSASVTGAASEVLGGEMTSAELLKGGTVTVPPNSQVLEMTVQAPSAELSSEAANAWADAYLVRRAERAAELVSARTARLQAALNEQQERRAELDPQNPDDQAELEVVINSISEIQKQLLQLGVGETEVGTVITEATTPSRPVKPQLPLYLGAGLVAGAALGLGLVQLLAKRRRKGQPTNPATTAVEVRVLASLPSADISSTQKEALRDTCREIASSGTAPGPLTLIGGGDATTATEVALEVTRAWAAEFGDGVMVATDVDSRTALPTALRSRPGLTDLLANRASPTECATRLDGSAALAIGPGIPSEVPASLNPGRVVDLWRHLKGEFGTVVVSSVGQGGPLGTLALQTSGPVVGIVRKGDHFDDELQALFDTLDEGSAEDRFVGVIIVDEAQPQPLSRATGSPPPKRGAQPTGVKIAPTIESPITGGHRDI